MLAIRRLSWIFNSGSPWRNRPLAQKSSFVLSLCRTFGVVSAFILLSACASFPGRGNNASELAETDAAAQTMEIASLEAEVARLKSQNARLANEVLALKREKDRIAAASEQAQEEADEAQTPPEEMNERSEPSTAVVDDAASPALARSDVPVQNSPRLVQPTFASNETVFENEAEGEIRTHSVLFGVHLASYRRIEEARTGWRQLQRENPDELGLLEPRVEGVDVENKGHFLRLIGGGFSSKGKAEALCMQLKAKDMFCSVASFEGERLSLAESDNS